MASPAGRRLRPLAVLCALLLVLWGAASAGSLVAQIMELNEYGWPDESSDGEVVTWVTLYLSAAGSGCWVAMWGLFGLGWRPPLHLGVLALLVAVGLEAAANLVQADYLSQFDASWSFADQLQWYGDRVTFQADGLAGDGETRAFFVALPLVTAWVPFLAWLVVVFSGAGRKRRLAPAYPQQYQQPYQQPYAPQPYAQQPYAPQPYAPQPYAPQPYAQQPPAYPQQPPAYRPPQRPAPPAARPPDQRDTLPYDNPGPGS